MTLLGLRRRESAEGFWCASQPEARRLLFDFGPGYWQLIQAILVAGSDQAQFQWQTACPRVWALTSRKNRCILSIRLGDLLWPFLVCLSLILSRAAIF